MNRCHQLLLHRIVTIISNKSWCFFFNITFQVLSAFAIRSHEISRNCTFLLANEQSSMYLLYNAAISDNVGQLMYTFFNCMTQGTVWLLWMSGLRSSLTYFSLAMFFFFGPINLYLHQIFLALLCLLLHPNDSFDSWWPPVGKVTDSTISRDLQNSCTTRSIHYLELLQHSRNALSALK